MTRDDIASLALQLRAAGVLVFKGRVDDTEVEIHLIPTPPAMPPEAAHPMESPSDRLWREAMPPG